MRIALIILSIIALIFIGSISWSLVSQEGWKLRVPAIGGGVSTTMNTSTDSNNIALETWKNQIKTDEKLERLTTIVEELAKKNGSYSPENIPTTSGGVITPEVSHIKPAGKLLALLMPTVTPVLEKNKGIFGLFIFDINVHYTTYKDESLVLTMIATDIGYDDFLKNIKALGKFYSINETKNFPFRSFFLNPETTDTIVRLVIEIENQTVALEIPKSKYDILKNLLLGKGAPLQRPTTESTIKQKTPTVTIIPSPKTPTPANNTVKSPNEVGRSGSVR